MQQELKTLVSIIDGLKTFGDRVALRLISAEGHRTLTYTQLSQQVDALASALAAEGRRSPDGGLQQFKPGIGLLLEHFQVPVIPVAIQGTFEALPTEKSLPRLVPIKVIFGKPMSAEELATKGSGNDLHARITTGLHEVIKELSNLREQV